MKVTRSYLSAIINPHAITRSLLVLLAVVICAGYLLASPQTSSKKSKPGSRRAITQRQKKMPATSALKNSNNKASKEPARGQADNPDGRLNWFLYQRAYPFNEVPANARRLAWESIPRRSKFGADLLSGEALNSVWSPIGPLPTTSAFPNNGGPTSGRINAIAVSPLDPQIVLIGSATGGIWRSSNGGTTFVPVTDTHVDLAVGSIAFATANPAIVYAGMGDNDQGYFGSGVLRSMDAGLTWTRINNTTLPEKGQSTKILVDPTNPNKVYLAQFNYLDAVNNISFVNGIYVSNDGGVNWTRTLNCSVRDLAIHPTNPAILYAGVSFRPGGVPGLYKSIDGGQTWNNILASPYVSSSTATRDFRVAVTPANPNRVYVYFGTRTTNPFEVRLEMSDDAGATWTNRGVIGNTSLDVGQFGYNTYLAASSINADTIYVGTRDLFRSTDGGVTFTNLSTSFAPNGNYQPFSQKFHADQQSFAFDPESSSTFYAGNDGGLWKTTDNGVSFTSLNNTLSLTQFVSMGVHPTDAARSFGGTQDNGTQMRLAGGSGWREFSSGDGGRLVINPLNPEMVFTSYVNGVMNRYTANGLSFSGKISDADSFAEPSSGPRIAFYPPIVSNGVDSKIYLGTWRLFICSDCNDTTRRYNTANLPTWTAPGGLTDLTNGGSDVLSAIGVAKSNNNIIYTGSRAGRAMVSVNGGVDWANITSGLPARSITSITVSPADPSLVYLTVSGYGTGHIFRSVNGGGSWTNISTTLPNIPVSAFLIDPLTATTFYAGTDIGVFRSTDSGETWTAFNDGLPPVPVMALSAQASGLIQIGTYGRGAYQFSASSTPSPTPTPTPTPTPGPTPTQYFISGTVKDNANNPVSGVLITFEMNVQGTIFSAMTQTDASGNYTSGNLGCPNNVKVTPSKTGFTFTPPGIVLVSSQCLTGTGTANFTATATPSGTQFSASSFVSGENSGSVQATVSRGDTAGVATVEYVTSDNAALNECNVMNGMGSSRCDYATTIGTLRFAIGESSKTIFIPVVDDAYAEGNEAFTITLRNPSGTTLGTQASATITIQDNDTNTGANPIDGVDFFIRQQYIDFLGREPDPVGLAGWRNVLNNCGTSVPPPCDRIEVSAGFFRSDEFQSRGYFIYRFFSALGRIPVSGEFFPDFAKVSGFLTAEQLEANKAAYVNEVMARADFQTKYSSTFSNSTAYVDALLQTVGLSNHPGRAGWINSLNANNNTQTRGQVLRQLVESGEVFNKYFNEAFVIMQYFGYLRRTADASYLNWIQTMTQTNGDYRIMINGFMNSSEYRRRFGP